MEHKIINRVGWFASIMAISMYSSYVDQIRLNLEGQKGSLVLAVATVINCSAWLVYGFIKEKKDN